MIQTPTRKTDAWGTPAPGICVRRNQLVLGAIRKIWRRGGDSNPRHPFEVKLISSQPCSATPAPLHEKTGRKCTAFAGVPGESIAPSVLWKLPQLGLSDVVCSRATLYPEHLWGSDCVRCRMLYER